MNFSSLKNNAFQQWWDKLGIWQLLVVILNLATIFVSNSLLHHTGKNTMLTIVAINAFAVIAAICIRSLAVIMAISLVMVAIAITTVIHNNANSGALIVMSIILTVFMLLGFVKTSLILAREMNMKAKTVWLSYIGVFLVVLTPLIFIIHK